MLLLYGECILLLVEVVEAIIMITKIYHDEDDNIYDHDEDYDVIDDLVVKASSSILAPVVSSCSARTRIKPVPYFLYSLEKIRLHILQCRQKSSE